MQKKWNYKTEESFDPQKFEAVNKVTNNKLLTGLLISRGIDTEKKAFEYLNPLEMDFTSPYDFCDMEIAVERILKAVENGEFILIHGDFDADGITSTALLSKVMTLLKANFEIYIPNRETESHGLSRDAIFTLRSKKGLKLVITCDCATGDTNIIQTIKTLNVDTIITDHHEPPQTLPNAYAIINPKVEGKVNPDLDIDKLNHLCNLAGVGVAFKLALAILDKIGQREFADELLPLVAVGTIADIVPVLGENRAFINMGLENISKGKNKGLFKLLKSAGINPKEGLKAENITYQVAPRLNSTGRLDKADEGYRLLVSDNEKEIERLCENLKNKNILRKTFCDKIFKEAVEQYEASADKDEKAIILYKEDWHLGVIGIVASKLIERYNKPVLMMCKDPNSDIIRSSARSISNINIHDLLNEIGDCFLSFGGHKGAAGLSFDPQEHSIEEIRHKIYALAKEYSSGLDLTPVLNIDLKIDGKDLDLKLIEELDKLEPCGAANPYPVFAIEGLTFMEQKEIGQETNHLKFTCSDSDNDTFECVFWNNKKLDVDDKVPVDIAFYPRINTFNGNTSLQLDIQDIHYQKIKKDYRIYDHRKKKNILPQVCDFVEKNAERVYIYTKNPAQKNELLKIGFPKTAFMPKENLPHLMFFDYPENETSMKQLIETINPKSLHFMDCCNSIANLGDLLNKVLGMTKYATHNKNGEFNIKEASGVIGTDENITKLAIEVLSESGAVKINSFDEKYISLEYLNPVSLKEVSNTQEYDEMKEKWESANKFKEEILKADENELYQMLQ